MATARLATVTLMASIAPALVVLSACSRPASDAGLMSLRQQADTLWLVPAPGVRLNAGYTPRLELESGVEVRFGTPAVSSDSLWFVEPPVAISPEPAAGLSGTLKASTCDNDAGYCRLVVLPVKDGELR